MTYWREVTHNWRFLAAASLGLSAGFLVFAYFNNHFVPPLLKEFGWSNSQLSLVGVTVIIPAICLPVVGRLTDIYGVRRIASVGVVGAPLLFVAMSMMTGDFLLYFLLTALQSIVVGATTTSLVYSRLVAQHFNLARGFAVGLSASAPALIGAISAPLLSGFIAEHGWRMGYLAVAGWSAAAGAVALALIPASEAARRVAAAPMPPFRLSDYWPLLRSRTFLIITIGILLCNLPYMMNGLQLKNILLERSLDDSTAAWMISLFATGVVTGRLLCGIALDRFPPPVVAAVTLGLPAIGLFILASGSQVEPMLAVAVSVLGLSLGAEADILAYLVMRYFKVEIYSTILGLVLASAAISAAFGSMLLSVTLRFSDSFTPFLLLTAVTTVIGSALYLLLGRASTSAAVLRRSAGEARLLNDA